MIPPDRELQKLRPLDRFGRPIPPDIAWRYLPNPKVEHPEYLLEIYNHPERYELFAFHGYAQLRCVLCMEYMPQPPTKITHAHTPDGKKHKDAVYRAGDAVKKYRMQVMTEQEIAESVRNCEGMPRPLPELVEGVNVPVGYSQAGNYPIRRRGDAPPFSNSSITGGQSMATSRSVGGPQLLCRPAPASVVPNDVESSAASSCSSHSETTVQTTPAPPSRTQQVHNRNTAAFSQQQDHTQYRQRGQPLVGQEELQRLRAENADLRKERNAAQDKLEIAEKKLDKAHEKLEEKQQMLFDVGEKKSQVVAENHKHVLKTLKLEKKLARAREDLQDASDDLAKEREKWTPEGVAKWLKRVGRKEPQKMITLPQVEKLAEAVQRLRNHFCNGDASFVGSDGASMLLEKSLESPGSSSAQMSNAAGAGGDGRSGNKAREAGDCGCSFLLETSSSDESSPPSEGERRGKQRSRRDAVEVEISSSRNTTRTRKKDKNKEKKRSRMLGESEDQDTAGRSDLYAENEYEKAKTQKRHPIKEHSPETSLRVHFSDVEDSDVEQC
ncbi:unnamed protein product [Amoebophrya sp. A120]|nr:unnamed protein product [Amoebophrya sp. A120]|eukprot:GSA120T00018764001.1